MSSMQVNNIKSIVNNTIQKTKNNYQDAISYLDSELLTLNNKPAHLNNLGLLFYQNVEYDLACHCFYFLIKHHPKEHSAYNNLGLALNRFGWGEKAVQQYIKALDLKKNYHQARSNYAYALHYFGETGRAEIKNAHTAINDYVFNQSKKIIDIDSIDYNPNKKITLGYISSDFRDHAVGRFLIGLFTHHDRHEFDVHVFDNRKNNNDETAKLLKSTDVYWHDISGLTTEDACQLISNTRIDILVDLSGHTNGGRPDIFSNRVAPAQITYLGYPNTSGLNNMDYRIGDHYADPVKFSEQNSETMLRLPVPMWNYTPWPNMPEFNPLPFENNGYITFGSANNHAKLQTQWLEVWAKALAALPKTCFKIKSRALKNPQMASNLLEFFSDRGVKKNRIIIEHYSPTKAEHWQSLASFDIALDSFPYNGTTTSCDLLWLGVPIISREGNSHVSRTTASLLNGVGLSDWVAKTDNDFIQLCEEKSNDKFALSQCRHNLRARMQNESLGNGALFTIEFEKVIKQAWQQSCEKSLN